MSLTSTPRTLNSSRAITVAANAAFMPIGIVTVLLGPMLPMLSSRWSLNYAQAGRLFSVQLLASTVAVTISGVMVSRWGFRLTIAAGLFAMAAGVGALPFCTYFPGLICIAAYGFGSGLAVPTANLVVAHINSYRRSAALNLLNFFWSLGAVACPFLVAAATALYQIKFFLVMVSTFLLVALAGLAVIPFTEVAPSQSVRDGKRFVFDYFRRPVFLLLAGIFFLYIGTEVGFGGWITTSAKSLSNLPSALPVIAPSFFYGTLMMGRWLASRILRRIQEITWARIGLLIAGIGMAGMIRTSSMAGVIVFAIIAGFGLSSVYPIAMSLLSVQFGRAAPQVGSVLFTLAHMGGAFLPWLVGYCSKQFANPKVGLAVPLASAMLMYGLYRAAPIASSVEPKVQIEG
jgi:FHS family glucose/mannose:H+ symporter-like MFS transporter